MGEIPVFSMAGISRVLTRALSVNCPPQREAREDGCPAVPETGRKVF